MDRKRHSEQHPVKASLCRHLPSRWSKRIVLLGGLRDGEDFTDQVFISAYNLINGFLANISFDGPGSENMALVEDLLNFLQASSSRFGEAKEDMDAGSKIKRGEDEISL